MNISLKLFFWTIMLCFLLPFMQAQSIKQQLQQQKLQQKYEQERKSTELKEAARLQKAQFSLQELINLADLEDISTVEKVLREKGYSIDETKASDELERISFGFDINNDRAKYWFHWFHSYENKYTPYWIIYQFVDETLYNKYEKSLIEKKFKKLDSEIISNNNGGIQNVYQNNRYKVTIEKRIKETTTGNIGYRISVLNYKKEEEKQEKKFAEYKEQVQKSRFTIQELLKLLSEEKRDVIYQTIIDKGLTVSPSWHSPNYQTIWIKNIQDSLMFTPNLTQFSADFPFENYFEINLCTCNSPDIFVPQMDSLTDNGILFNSMNIKGNDFISDIIATGFQKVSVDTIDDNTNWEYCSAQRIVEKFHYSDLELIIAYNNCEYPDDCKAFEAFLYNYKQAESRRMAIKQQILLRYQADSIAYKHYNDTLQSCIAEVNRKLLAYPYNLRQDTISNTLSKELYGNNTELQKELHTKISKLPVLQKQMEKLMYEDVRTNNPQHFVEIYYAQTPSEKKQADSLYIECRCKYARSSFHLAFIDRTLMECNCRNLKYNEVGHLFHSKDEFNQSFNQPEIVFLEEIANRNMKKNELIELKNILSNNPQVNLKKGRKSKKEKIKTILEKINTHYRGFYYTDAVGLLLEFNEKFSQDWYKNGIYFKSPVEMYEYYIEDDYDKVLKQRKF